MPRFAGRYAARTYRRRTARRKQQSFRRKYYGMRKNKTYSSNTSGGLALRFKRRKFTPRTFIRRSYKASEEQTKYRTLDTANANVTVPTALGTCNVVTLQAIASNFQFTTGGLVLGTGTVTSDDSWGPRLFIRGGMINIMFCNRLANATNVRIKLWLCHARNVEPATVNTAYTLTGVASSFDPTVLFSWYKVIRAPILHYDKILELGDSWTVEHRVKPFSWPQWDEQQTAAPTSLPWWIFTVEPCQVAAAASVDVTYGYNMSFTGDLNGEAY